MADSTPRPGHEAVDGDPHDLQRFVDAQAPVYSQVVGELLRGRKTSHWMWFVFPQLRGLGRSSMAHAYGLQSADEAIAYAQHPVLGARLRECTRLVVEAAAKGRTAHEIFGSPDDLKLQSCLTLFAAAANDRLFADALQAVCGGRADSRTLDLLKRR